MGSGQRAQLNQSVCTYTDAMTIGETAQISGSVRTARWFREDQSACLVKRQGPPS
jgi:hypothetical protein